MNQFMLGAVATACFVVGLFFVQYWRGSRDRFFLFLALSFWIEAGNRVGMAITRSAVENEPLHYAVRLIAYGLIIVAIWDKNRSHDR